MAASAKTGYDLRVTERKQIVRFSAFFGCFLVAAMLIAAFGIHNLFLICVGIVILFATAGWALRRDSRPPIETMFAEQGDTVVSGRLPSHPHVVIVPGMAVLTGTALWTAFAFLSAVIGGWTFPYVLVDLVAGVGVLLGSTLSWSAFKYAFDGTERGWYVAGLIGAPLCFGIWVLLDGFDPLVGAFG
jgi:hypothetical protein